MKTTMLEHQKKVIINLCHDRVLVDKEMSKARRWLSEAEYNELRKWYKINYGIKEFLEHY